MSDRIRVLLVDDDALVRASLKMLLDGATQIEVVGEADDGRGVLAAVDRHHPDVVLMDIRMPQLDGIAATRLLRTQSAPPPVIVLTTFDADELVLRALQAGAAGFLLKHTPPLEIVRAIESVHAGEGTLSPAIAKQLITLVAGDGDGDATARQDRARESLRSLTDREREVALAVGQGRSNADIAGELFVTVATVKAHVSRVLTKLQAENRVSDRPARPRRQRRTETAPAMSRGGHACAIRASRASALGQLDQLRFDRVASLRRYGHPEVRDFKHTQRIAIAESRSPSTPTRLCRFDSQDGLPVVLEQERTLIWPASGEYEVSAQRERDICIDVNAQLRSNGADTAAGVPERARRRRHRAPRCGLT